jgi:anti-anti-sigma factor
MSEPLSVEAASFGEVPVLRLGGDLTYGQDLATIHEATARLKGAGHDRVIVDLSAVRTLDSSGISALLDIRQTLGKSSEHVILLRPSERVRGTLAQMRVASLFTVVEDEADLPARIGGHGTSPAHGERRRQ